MSWSVQTALAWCRMPGSGCCGSAVAVERVFAQHNVMAEYTGLVDAVTTALADTYRGPWLHAPGRVFTDLAVAVADGADAISGIGALSDRVDLHGRVASMPTTWRVLDRVDSRHLPAVRAARATARAQAWAAGAGPDLTEELLLDFDATIAHSEKENAAATWKRTFGFHPLLCFLDRPDIAGGEALAGLLRPGNAGSNTAADHLTVLDLALAALPVQARPVRDAATGCWAGPLCWPAPTLPAQPMTSLPAAWSVASGSPSDSLSTGESKPSSM